MYSGLAINSRVFYFLCHSIFKGNLYLILGIAKSLGNSLVLAEDLAISEFYSVRNLDVFFPVLKEEEKSHRSTYQSFAFGMKVGHR